MVVLKFVKQSTNILFKSKVALYHLNQLSVKPLPTKPFNNKILNDHYITPELILINTSLFLIKTCCFKNH